MRRRLALLALVALAFIRPLAAQVPSCGATTEPLRADSLATLGRFWHALRAAPALPRPPRSVPQSLAVLYARIDTGLGRWKEAGEVLRRVRGRDTLPEAVALAAFAAEHLEQWREAEVGFRRVVELATTSAELRGQALVHLAFAFEALGRRDSAVVTWRRAAQALPEIADWLALRRAALEPDTTLVLALVSAARSPGAAQRADAYVAQRRLAAGNAIGALDLYRRWGRSLDIARVEYTIGQRRTARLRADSVLLIDPTRPHALLAANLLREQHDTLTVREEAGLARVYRALNDLASAERTLRSALARGDTNVALWLELAALRSERRDPRGALAAVDSADRHTRRLGTPRVAAARVTAYAAAKEYGRADTLLLPLVEHFPGDSSVARAVLLLAEHDRALVQTPDEMRRYWLLVARFPLAPATNVARFRLALWHVVLGQRDSAEAILADVVARDSAGALGTAPRFWRARLRWDRGDSTAAAFLRRIAQQEPFSYYGVRARELLGEPLGFVPDSAIAPPRPGSFAPARARERVRMLASLGFDVEARAEAIGWIGDSASSVHLLAAVAGAAAAAGLAREAILLGQAVQARAGITVAAARGVQPLPYRVVIEGEAAEQCLDPLLMAAIIRQESRFTARVTSRAGARGMSQVMPATGRQLAQWMRIAGWDAELLFIPDFNLHLGSRFLADRLRVDSFPVYAAIAAYNAGAQRVDRWRLWPEFGDPDLFVERVAIAETRNYVKTVYASYQWYRRAYATPIAPPLSGSLEPSSP